MTEILQPAYLSDRRFFQAPDSDRGGPAGENFTGTLRARLRRAISSLLVSTGSKKEIGEFLPQVKAHLSLYDPEESEGRLNFVDKGNNIQIFIDFSEEGVELDSFIVYDVGRSTKDFSEDFAYYDEDVFQELSMNIFLVLDLEKPENPGTQDENITQLVDGLKSRMRFTNKAEETFTLADLGAALDAKDPAAQGWVVTLVEENLD